MIRSLNTLVPQQSNSRANNFFKSSITQGMGGLEDSNFTGWGPEVQILSEADLKRIEKQEDRESRYRKMRTR